MTSKKSFPMVALCYLLFFFSCQSNPPLDAAFRIPGAFLLTGTIAPNPNYVENDDDQDRFIVTTIKGGDAVATSIGVQVAEEAFVFLISCVYVFEEVRLANMSLVGESCEAFPSTPHGVEVASERLQFLLFEPSDEFWACWLEEGGGVVKFQIWVRANEVH